MPRTLSHHLDRAKRRDEDDFLLPRGSKLVWLSEHLDYCRQLLKIIEISQDLVFLIAKEGDLAKKSSTNNELNKVEGICHQARDSLIAIGDAWERVEKKRGAFGAAEKLVKKAAIECKAANAHIRECLAVLRARQKLPGR